jgi:glycosyltransferase involved in cell wall biosynthesis
MGIADRLEWMGYIPSQTAIFNNLDICVVPSRINEGFGLVAAESAAHGVPVIATRRGALPEVVVEGVTGLTVDEPLEESLAEKLTVLLRSPELRIRFGTDAAIHARQVLSAQRMIDDFEALCRQLGYCAKGIAR